MSQNEPKIRIIMSNVQTPEERAPILQHAEELREQGYKVIVNFIANEDAASILTAPRWAA